MTNYSHTQLRRELRSAGASAAESDELLTVASRLQALKTAQPAGHIVRSRWARLAPLAATAVVFLVLGMGTVSYAQSSLPGTLLYPVKRISENAAVAMDPSYRATLMMRRAEEVNQLVAAHANTHTVQATLADYKVEASAYKTKDYAALSYCKSALQQASAKATPHEQQMIASTLNSLRDID